jgi:hypothetical protein
MLGAVAAASSSGTSFVTSDFQDLPATVSWPLDAPLDVVLADVDLGRLTPCMLVQTANQGVLGLVQMCAWDTLSPQWGPMSQGYTVPVLIWNCAGTIPAMPASLGGIAGTTQWTVSGTDKYYAADIDGDGIQEILATQAGMLGVLKWAGNALYVLWSGSVAPSARGANEWLPMAGDGYLPVRLGTGVAGQDALLAWDPSGAVALLGRSGDGLQSFWSGPQVPGSGGNAGWTILPTDAWWTMDLAGQGIDSVVLSRPGAIGVAQFNENADAFSIVWSSGPNLSSAGGTQSWPLQSGDQYAVAPLQSGTSQESLVLFNATTLAAGVAQWDAGQSQLQLQWLGQDAIPQGAGGCGVPLGSSTVVLAAALQANVPMVLFAQSGAIGCVQWDGTQLAGQWLQQVSVFPAVGGAPPWQCDSDQYTVVAGPVIGQQQLLARVGGGTRCGLLVFNGSDAMNCCWQSTGAGVLPGWGLPLIASGPQSGYPPLGATPDSLEAEMFAALSNEVADTGNLRDQYTRTNSATVVQGWMGQIQSMDIPPPPVPPVVVPPVWYEPAGIAVWNTVRQTVLGELQNLQAVYGFYANLLTLAAAIDTQMDADLAHVIAQVAPPSSGAPQVAFSLWNLVASLPAACVPLSTRNPALGTGLALLMPLLPTPLMQNQQASQQLDYDQVQGVVDAAFGNVSGSNALGQSGIASDVVKAGMVVEMAQQGWVWPAPSSPTDNVAADIAAVTQNGNRVQFYVTVIPAAYTIYDEQTSFSHLRGDRWIKTPSWAAWTTTIGGEPWCYTIATGDNMEMDFPSQAMMSDVLSLAQASDFFLGNGPWAGLRRASW